MNRPKSKQIVSFVFTLALLGSGLWSSLALGETKESDWQVSSTLDLNAQADETTTVINVTECRDQVAAGGDEIFTFNQVSGTMSSSAYYSIKVALGSETCAKTDLAQVDTDTCLTLVENEPLSASILPIDVTVALDQLTSVKSADDCENVDESAQIYLIVEDPPLLADPTIYAVTYSVRFKTARPTAPANVAAEGGEESILVTWDEISSIDDYKIYVTTATIDAGAKPDTITDASVTSVTKTGSRRVTGATANTVYSVAVTSVDTDGNESLVGTAVDVETGVVDDFWERYNAENPGVDGGYCFIATAAYGSYQEPHVQLLRQFRDEYLLTNDPGRAFVALYYQWSPTLADAIAERPWARSVTRVALVPLYLGAAMLLNTTLVEKLGLFLLFGLLMVGLSISWRNAGRHRPRHSAVARWLVAALLFSVFLGVGWTSAFADESPVNMMAEVKGGPYRPDGLGDTYTQYFGKDSSTMFEFELDYQFYRGFGSAALGGSLAYASADGKALTASNAASIDTTSLAWLPLRLALIYRFDMFATHWDVPFVLYGKAGLDYYVWWVDNGAGNTSTSATGKNGSGGTFGWHAALGAAFLLDWLEPSTAIGFDVEWGVNNSYLFAEYLLATIDDLGSSSAFDLSDNGTFQIGLALEF